MYSSDDYEQDNFQPYGKDCDYANYDGEFGGHTRDPNSDSEYNRQYFKMPQLVKEFLQYFRNALSEGSIFELQNLYEVSWPKLTEDFFEKRPWPEEGVVTALVENDPVFMILYKELYFRHIYARIQGGPTLEHQFNSFYNYCDLFNYILSEEEPVPLKLSDLWLWELVDEFDYQFQSFAQYQVRLQKKTAQELETLNSHNKAWNVLSGLNVLHSLVDKSNISSSWKFMLLVAIRILLQEILVAIRCIKCCDIFRLWDYRVCILCLVITMKQLRF